MIRQTFLFLTNNVLVNRLLVFSRLDRWIVNLLHMYRRVKLDTALPPQLMAGFSQTRGVQEAIDKAHRDLAEVSKNLLPGASVLDIGCGAGAYLEDFKGRGLNLTGIDLNTDMIAKGKEHVPEARFIEGDFLKTEIDSRFDLIYSVSVLEFIPPSQLGTFFRRVKSLLRPDGILFLHYPHALNKLALYYPDILYIEYSPDVIGKKAGKYLRIIFHEHAFDGRIIIGYDNRPYDSKRSFKNGYLLVAINDEPPE